MKSITKSFDYKYFARYAVFLALMVMLCLARTSGGVAPFGLGFFAGLIYCKQNFVLIAPMYALGMLLSAPSITTLIVAIAPIVILGSAYYLHRLSRRPLKMWTLNIYALLSQLPLILLGLRDISTVITSVCTVVLAQVFTYTTSLFLHAVLVRGSKYRFRVDELIACMALIVGLGMGLFSLNIFGFRPFYLVTCVAIVLVASTSSPLPAIITAAMLGVGAGIMTGNIMMVGGLTVIAIATAGFNRQSYYLGIAAYVLLDLFVGVYFNAFGNYDLLHFIAVIVGVAICLCFPRSFRTRISNNFCGYRGNLSVSEVIDRNRKEIYAKLNHLSRLFSEMGDLLIDERLAKSSREVDCNRVSSEVALTYCGNCPNNSYCTQALGSDTSPALIDLVTVADQHGEASIENVNAFLGSRCNRIVGLISAVNAAVSLAKRKAAQHHEITVGKLLVGEQLLSVGGLMQSIALDARRPVSYDGGKEKSILDELACHDILCTDLIFSSVSCGFGLTMLVRKCDLDNHNLTKIVSKCLGCTMEVLSYRNSSVEGFVHLLMQNAPRYGVCCGVSNRADNGGNTSGDSYALTDLGNGKFMLALSDGMGKGVNAHYNSSVTINIIENFYRAGFDNTAILSLVNKVLSTYSGDNFTCLDLAMIDLHSGICDFIKLGAVNGIIMRGKSFITVEGGSLPLGIVEEALPTVERKALLAGDVLTMVSDGIIDTLGEEEIQTIMMSTIGANPQLIADTIMQTALRCGVYDDATVITVKIFLKESPQKVAKTA